MMWPSNPSPPNPSIRGPSGAAGFTLVELTVSALIASVLLGAIYQVLVTNQRVSTVQREQVAGHQTVRAGADLLSQELREVSASGGDLLVMEDDRVGFRALRAQGVACTIGSLGSPVLRVAVMTRPFAEGEDLYVFADLDPETEADDVWIETEVTQAEGDETCGTEALSAQDLTVSGLQSADWAAIRPGAQVRSWEEVEYTVQDFSGEPFLVRVEDESAARLVGPLAEDGLTLEYMDEDGLQTLDPTSVRSVRLRIRTASDATTALGEAIADSVVTTVHLRN